MKNKLKEKTINLKKNFFSYLSELKLDLSNFKGIGIKKVLSKRKFEIGAILIILVFIMISIPAFFYESKEGILDSFKRSLVEENAKELSKIVMVNGKKVKAEELEPVIRYYNDNKEEIEKTVNELKKSNNSSKFYIESKNGILKEKYYIDLEKINVTFQTDVNGIELSVGNIKNVVNDKVTLDLIPGVYEGSYELKTNYGDVRETINFKAMNDTKISIDVPATFITIYSNFDDAEVFINNSDTLKVASEIKEFGPIPKNTKIYLQREFPWGVLKSESIDINDENYIRLDINMVNNKLTEEVNKCVNEFYDSTFEALNKRDYNLILNATENTKGKIYDYINEKTLLFSNNYEITDLNVEIEKSDFKYEDNKYKASLVTSISYSVYKKVLPFLKTPNNSLFLLSLEYEGGKFYVSDIQQIDIID